MDSAERDLGLIGMPVRESPAVPNGRIVKAVDGARTMLLVSSRGVDLWRLRHGARDPFLSRYCEGAREVRRVKRRKGTR